MAELLNIDWVIEQILAQIQHLPTESINLFEAYGRVLAEDVRADVDLPPFACSSMDGYAVQAQDTQNAPTQLQVIMDIPAGTAPYGRLTAGTAARIMTGAIIPDGADAVIPVEDTNDDFKTLGAPAPQSIGIHKTVNVGENIRPRGENIRTGELILRAGTVLRPQDLGTLASLGVSPVGVIRQPRIAILTSGDELLAPHEPLTPGKIRDSNTVTIAGLVRQCGGVPLVLPIAGDSQTAVRDLFRSALALNPDALISTAGVSVGTADYVRMILEELGEINFWRVNLRPGKPLAYGTLNGKPFFGLPGNPVSAMVTFDVVARPALLKMQGRTDTPTTLQAISTEDIPSDGRRSYIRVTLRQTDGQTFFTPTGTQSSGALMSMVLADGLAIIPEGVKLVTAGTSLEVRLLRDV